MRKRREAGDMSELRRYRVDLIECIGLPGGQREAMSDHHGAGASGHGAHYQAAPTFRSDNPGRQLLPARRCSMG
jgi:hypothetical protein